MHNTNGLLAEAIADCFTLAVSPKCAKHNLLEEEFLEKFEKV